MAINQTPRTKFVKFCSLKNQKLVFHKFEIISHYYSETFNLNGIYDDEL